METDWLALWRELSAKSTPSSTDECVARYEAHMRKRTERPDHLLNFVIEKTQPGDMVLDIGAGGGRWTIPLAAVAKSVTAVEPSGVMRDFLRNNAEAAQVDNILVVPYPWEEAAVEPHDIIVCAHAMYSSPDFHSFVRKMEQYARKTCYLAMRLPLRDGIINELSFAVYGRHHDSPNAMIAYNALYSMGIYANVLVENHIHYWANDTLDEAFARAKRHLYLHASSVYDELILDTLRRRLIPSENGYAWPDGMRSALIWWTPSSVSIEKGSGD